MADNTRNTDWANNIAQEAMTEAHGTCNNIYTQVDSTRDTLRVSWQGAASNRYSEALVGWLEELRLITNDMNNMIGVFGGTVQSMHNAEDFGVLEGSRWASELNPNQA
ncbi:hypothetical protein [Nocardiopsis sp. CNT312]|uniref:hypothetical protein n=1 Tax=Nocardiopsis sp. CNT312 TaxID=1137268 RepID=UPI00048CC8EA|nr:hypothetical protein [Nocardiopsis sp. CNT312]